jgi:outer membrane immunogenic protein
VCKPATIYKQQPGLWHRGFRSRSQKSDPSCLTFCYFNFLTPANLQFYGVTQRIPWFATLRGRIGVNTGPLLFYATGGGALANIKTTYGTNELARFTGEAADRRVGLALGGGIEAMLTGNWTAKVEYLFLNSGVVSDTFTYQTPGGFGPPATAFSVVSGRVVDHVVRAGLNYRFGDPAPVAAPALMPTKAPPIAPVAYDWNGFYIGGNLGYSVGRDAASEDIFGLFGNSDERFMLVPRGAIGGGQIGTTTRRRGGCRSASRGTIRLPINETRRASAGAFPTAAAALTANPCTGSLPPVDALALPRGLLFSTRLAAAHGPR